MAGQYTIVPAEPSGWPRGQASEGRARSRWVKVERERGLFVFSGVMSFEGEGPASRFDPAAHPAYREGQTILLFAGSAFNNPGY